MILYHQASQRLAATHGFWAKNTHATSRPCFTLMHSQTRSLAHGMKLWFSTRTRASLYVAIRAMHLLVRRLQRLTVCVMLLPLYQSLPSVMMLTSDPDLMECSIA
jgi:hypothetical protein